ncbi:MAG: hypothetical protein IJJ64_09725 [Butyrivibrio sp.]|nr:hypothetical protein [Butyrivibrio sp.]
MRKIEDLYSNMQKIKGIIAIAGAAGMFTLMSITAGATDTAASLEAISAGNQATAVDATSVSGEQNNVEAASQTHKKVAFEYSQNSTVKGTDRVVETNLDGHYYASGVEGIAMTDQEWSLQKDAGMAIVEYFFVTTWDITQDTAPKAVNTFRIVAESEQAELGPVVQINIHKTFNGVMTSLDGNPAKVTTVIGIPEDFREDGARYAVVSVKSGGFFDILPDLDEDDLTVTFKANAGNGAYAIIRY